MKKGDVYKDIEETFGFVPTFMKSIPDSTIEHEWALFKKIQLEDSLSRTNTGN